jgi:hypothetical protein
LTALGLIVFSIFAFALVRVKLRAGEIDSARLPSFTALGAALVVGFLAPMSWFILAKPHSYVHPQMNFVLWYLPFGLLAAVAIAVLAEEFLRSIVEVSRVRPVIIAMLVVTAAVLVVRQERDYRRVARDCWGPDASVTRRNGSQASLNPVRKEVCFRYSSFDVFSEGDITVDYLMSDKTVRSEKLRILENYFRLPLWRGREVVVASRWPSGATAPVVVRRLKSDGHILDEWYLPPAK